jgi:hypothetical protein
VFGRVSGRIVSSLFPLRKCWVIVVSYPNLQSFSNEEVPLPFWITVIHLICKFISYMNDLLSCPKEVLAGKTWNYLHMKTQVRRQVGRLTKFRSQHEKLWTFRDTRCETIEEVQKTTLALDQAFTTCIRTDIWRHPAGANNISDSTGDERSQIY